MKIWKVIACSVVMGGVAVALHTYGTYHTPPHYRDTNKTIPSPYTLLKGYLKGYNYFNPTGIEKLNAVASGYLDLVHLDSLRQEYPKSLIVLNGLADEVEYIKDRNLKFYCLDHKEGEELVTRSRGGAKDTICNLRRFVAGIYVPQDHIRDVRQEMQLLQERGVPYIRPLPSNWLNDWSFMSELISFFESVTPEQTLYFHCGHGQGRTTTMLTLWDVYNNAHDVPLEDIMARQFLLGGEDLMDVKPWKDGTWPEEQLVSRRDLIVSFYKYMTDPNGYGSLSWEQWLGA